uniref:Uncharacterized protein n=1 Tax=Arundo donax TaxID=35708 RepID=A0A0A8Y3L1_ARUDO
MDTNLLFMDEKRKALPLSAMGCSRRRTMRPSAWPGRS